MLFSLLALLSLSATPDELIKSAESIRSLESFLDSYMGECNKGDAEEVRACKTKAQEFRKAANQKTFVVDVPSSFARKMRPVESKDPHVYVYEFTPFFDGGGYGVTFGKPMRFDRDGSPIVRVSSLKIPVKGVTGESAILDGLKVDRVTVTLVFKPGEMWQTPKVGGKAHYGVSVKPVLLRLQETRSGETADTVF